MIFIIAFIIYTVIAVGVIDRIEEYALPGSRAATGFAFGVVSFAIFIGIASVM